MHATRFATLAALTLVIASPSAVRAQQASTAATATPRAIPSDAELLALLRQRVAEKRSAGIVVGVLHPDGHTQLVATGDPGPGQPPLDGNTVFEIGSISKVFTATLLAEMVEEGKVRLDDPVQKYLPASVHVPTRGDKQITLGTARRAAFGIAAAARQHAPRGRHQSVRRLHRRADSTISCRATRCRAIPVLRSSTPTSASACSGTCSLTRDGKSYETLARERMLRPLGMTHTSITLTPWMRDHFARGHDEQGHVVANWDIPTFAGAGAIRSTALDMLKFVDANLHPERGPLGARHGARAAGARARRIRGCRSASTGSSCTPAPTPSSGTTAAPAATARTSASRRRGRLGVVVLTNSGGAGADDIGMHLLDPDLPLAPNPVTLPQRTAIELSPDVLARYVGRYQLAPDFILDVTARDGAVYVHPTGQPILRLWPESETRFFLKEVDAQIDFVSDARGPVTGLVLHQGGRDMPGSRLP